MQHCIQSFKENAGKASVDVQASQLCRLRARAVQVLAGEKRAKMFVESDRGLVVGIFALLYYCFLFSAQMPYLCQRCPSQVFRFFQYLVYKQHCWTIQGYKGNATMRWDGPRTECFMMTHRDSTGNRPSGDGADLFITISLSRQRFYDAISLSREPLRFLYHGNICIFRDATFALRNAKVAAIKRLIGPLDERIP